MDPRTPLGRARIEIAIGTVFVVGFVVDVVRGLTARQTLIGMPFFLIAVAVLAHGIVQVRRLD